MGQIPFQALGTLETSTKVPALQVGTGNERIGEQVDSWLWSVMAPGLDTLSPPIKVAKDHETTAPAVHLPLCPNSHPYGCPGNVDID